MTKQANTTTTAQKSKKAGGFHDFEDRHFDADVYDKEYFEGEGSKSGYVSYTDAKGIVTDQFEIINGVMRSRVENLTHLDVGCAYGFSNLTMLNRGWHTYGFDVSEFAIEKARELHPAIEFWAGDATDKKMYDYSKTKRGLVTAVELFEHIESKDVPVVLKNMANNAEWGLFVVNARTNPDQDHDDSHGDHGHLNNHSMAWWINEVAQFGTLDFDAMFEFSKQAEATHPSVHWHNRVIVVKFNQQ